MPGQYGTVIAHMTIPGARCSSDMTRPEPLAEIIHANSAVHGCRAQSDACGTLAACGHSTTHMRKYLYDMYNHLI